MFAVVINNFIKVVKDLRIKNAFTHQYFPTIDTLNKSYFKHEMLKKINYILNSKIKTFSSYCELSLDPQISEVCEYFLSKRNSE